MSEIDIGMINNGSAGLDRRGVDVLLITAIKEEYEAARAVTGRSDWTDHDTGGMAPYATATLPRLSVAIARPTRMSGRSVAAITAVLTDRLKPRCVAMCGVCAGDPRATAPGDVIVAAPAYEWDLDGHAFPPDYQRFPQDSQWARAAQDFVPSGLASYGPASPQEATVWFLERLRKGQNPRTDPARGRYFPGLAWGAQLKLL
jgi:nucleoside phosphorylase